MAQRLNHLSDEKRNTMPHVLHNMYQAMLKALGPQHWWPGDSVVEIMVGAILTQNTNWRNVERAMANLKRAGMLDWRRLLEVDESALAALIQPSGTFRVKARRLKALTHFLFERYGGDPGRMAATDMAELRAELLGVSGIGPETADAILLYALERPTFVIDAYTRRILARHGLAARDAAVDALKALFEGNLKRDRALFNEYHALLVRVGKDYCRTTARCEGCPLAGFPHDVER
jgi:endonuclease-3 related protein